MEECLEGSRELNRVVVKEMMIVVYCEGQKEGGRKREIMVLLFLSQAIH